MRGKLPTKKQSRPPRTPTRSKRTVRTPSKDKTPSRSPRRTPSRDSQTTSPIRTPSKERPTRSPSRTPTRTAKRTLEVASPKEGEPDLSEEQQAELVEWWKENPCLYDKVDPNYAKKNHKDFVKKTKSDAMGISSEYKLF